MKIQPSPLVHDLADVLKRWPVATSISVPENVGMEDIASDLVRSVGAWRLDVEKGVLNDEIRGRGMSDAGDI